MMNRWDFTPDFTQNFIEILKITSLLLIENKVFLFGKGNELSGSSRFLLYIYSRVNQLSLSTDQLDSEFPGHYPCLV